MCHWRDSLHVFNSEKFICCVQIQDVNNSLLEQQQSLSTIAERAAFSLDDDDQLQDTMLAAYWAAVNI